MLQLNNMKFNFKAWNFCIELILLVGGAEGEGKTGREGEGEERERRERQREGGRKFDGIWMHADTVNLKYFLTE